MIKFWNIKNSSYNQLKFKKNYYEKLNWKKMQLNN